MGKIVPLRSANLGEFDCGNSSLNRWFRLHASQNEAAGFSRTYVMEHDGQIIGFYSLSAAAVDLEPSALGVESAPDQIPAILLGRMAVAKRYQGVGVGKRLLADASLVVKAVAKNVGATVLLVHPKTDAVDYYRKLGFHRLDSLDALYLRI